MSAALQAVMDGEQIEPDVVPVVHRRTRTSLSRVGWLPDDEMSAQEWESQGRWLGSIGRCSQWWIGDWVRFGTARYGEKYQLAAKLTGYDEHSLRNIAYVASRYPQISRRRDDLSFSHHAELAAMEPAEQDRWLERARAQRMSVSALRASLREHRQSATREAAPRPTAPRHISCPHCGQEIDLDGDRAESK